MKVCLLASGSKGNCIVVSGSKHALIIDAGLSGRMIRSRIKGVGLSEERISAILVSHEHSDHIKGVGTLSRGFGVPVFINEGTLSRANGRLGNIPDIRLFQNNSPFTFHEFLISPFSVPHDCADGTCFVISERYFQPLLPLMAKKRYIQEKLVILTDLGYVPSYVQEQVKSATTIILESNHDIDRLINGPYEWWLKQRIRSDNGHLSNEQACELVNEIIHDGLKNIILAHLSEENNEPEIAYREMKAILSNHGSSCRLHIAKQYEPTDWIEV
jgi:phosphoribosyl 1,2-cyclic phosphodiesterase